MNLILSWRTLGHYFWPGDEGKQTHRITSSFTNKITRNCNLRLGGSSCRTGALFSSISADSVCMRIFRMLLKLARSDPRSSAEERVAVHRAEIVSAHGAPCLPFTFCRGHLPRGGVDGRLDRASLKSRRSWVRFTGRPPDGVKQRVRRAFEEHFQGFAQKAIEPLRVYGRQVV